jgi:16S rRNA processing protein RimM
VLPQGRRVVLGRAVGAHGLQGEVRVRYFGDGPENLMRTPEIWLGQDEEDSEARKFSIERVGTGRGGELRVAFEGVKDRDAAIALRGLLVLGDIDYLEPLEEGEFYWHQLVGCQVETKEGRVIGIVQEIWETGAHDVLVVESPDGRRHLISTAREIVPEIDPDAGRIVVELVPGMLD